MVGNTIINAQGDISMKKTSDSNPSFKLKDVRMHACLCTYTCIYVYVHIYQIQQNSLNSAVTTDDLPSAEDVRFTF